MENTVKQPNFLMRFFDKRLTTSQFTYKQIIDLFVPMMLDQLSIYIISILSTAMISASSEEAIAAVSLVNSLAFMVTALFSALSTGGTVLVAQAKGRGDALELRRACGQTIMLTTAIGLLCTVILVGLANPIVHLLFGSADPLIIEYGITYLQLYGLSFMPFALYVSVVCCFRGLGEAKECLWLTIIINGVHLVMCYILINLLDWGIAGSGTSFIIARAVGGIAAFLIIFFFHNTVGLRLGDLFHFSKKFVKEIFRLALPFALEQILFQGGQLLTSSYVSQLPTESIAAHGIAMSVNNLFYTIPFALQNLIMTVCGQCIGAKNYDLAKQYVKQLIKIGRVLLLINVLVVMPFVPLLMLLYKPSAVVEPIVYQLLLIIGAAIPVLWADAYLIPACLRAAGDAVYTTVVCLAAMWIAKVAIGYVLTITLGWGIHMVWAVNFIEFGIRAVVFHIRFRGTKWQKM